MRRRLFQNWYIHTKKTTTPTLRNIEFLCFGVQNKPTNVLAAGGKIDQIWNQFKMKRKKHVLIQISFACRHVIYSYMYLMVLSFKDLSHNNLKEVPSELEKAKNCIVLNLANNK